jgi:hypothetical protein
MLEKVRDQGNRSIIWKHHQPVPYILDYFFERSLRRPVLPIDPEKKSIAGKYGAFP